MIDLNQMVEHFLEQAVWQCKNYGGKEDEAVIRFLNDQELSIDVRRSEVLKWLRYYGVLRNLKKEDQDPVARVIVEFADARGTLVPPPSEAEIIDKFTDLHAGCCSKVQPNQSGTPRSLTSLTSKALWCCYPKAVPIFDSYARCALGVLSRLMDLDRPPDDKSEYKRFVSVWLNLYRRVERTIDDVRLGGYPYKVRVFDRILWIIGEPDLGVKRHQLASAL